MKIDANCTHAHFQPITLTITIENREELGALYVMADDASDAYNSPDCLEVLWDKLDDIMLEVKKNG